MFSNTIIRCVRHHSSRGSQFAPVSASSARRCLTQLRATDKNSSRGYCENNGPAARTSLASSPRQHPQRVVYFQAMSSIQQRQQLRPYHSSPFLSDEAGGGGGEGGGKELSAKEKKKMLKAKAKAAMAEQEKEKEEAAAKEESASPPPAAAAKEEKPKAKDPAKPAAAAAEAAEEKAKAKDPAPPPAAAEAAEEKPKEPAPPPPETEKEDEKPAAATAPSTATPSAAPEVGSSSAEPASSEPEYSPPHDANGVRQYTYSELTEDAQKHKEGLSDPTRPEWQNPLHHNNPDHDGTKCYPEDFDSPEEFEAAVVPLPPIDDGSGREVAPQHIHDLADEMVNLTMLEMSELVNKIAEHYGFHEGMLAPGVAGAGGADGDEDDEEVGGGGGATEAQTAFDVKLVGFDAKAKIKIIKEARSIVPGLGLKEAKELVESAPVAIQKGLSKENAEEIKAKLEALGAEIEIV